MSPRRKLEDVLEELEGFRSEPHTPEALACLRDALYGRWSHAAARAAIIAAESELTELIDDLAKAFQRFMVDPAKTDKGCAAKTAIIDALYRLGYDNPDLFLAGVRHRQKEPVWGGKADTAAQLRGVSALGLVRLGYHGVLEEIADLLADTEVDARRAAVQALVYRDDATAAPLLRLKALTGDDDPQVIGECMSALLRITPDSGVEFVQRFLDEDHEAIAELAAIALGSSRVGAALPALRQWWERTAAPPKRRTALLAIGMLRSDEAFDFLFSVAAESEGPNARDAVQALATYKHDDRIREKVRAIVKSRHDVDLGAAFDEFWGT
jgi:HEAT repeat protein